MDEVVPYPCNVSTGRSKTKPTTAHAVRPGDIDLVAAMGDSLTAGSGAYAVHLFHIATENRGVASFIGTLELLYVNIYSKLSIIQIY